jgi:hypothetical protein
MANTFSNLNINTLGELSFIGGTYQELIFDVYDASGSPIDVSSYTFDWYLSPFGQPDVVSVIKTGTSASSSGYVYRFVVALNSEDTATLSGKYIQQPVLTTAPGYEFRLAQGYINVIPASGLSTVAESSTFASQIAATNALVTSISGSYMAVTGSMTALQTSTNTAITNISASIVAVEAEMSDGWVDPHQAWSYLSASAINVPAGAASKYSPGDKIKFTQGTVKYYYVLVVEDTVLQLTGGSDYIVANAVISSNYYSKVEIPAGFPAYFNWTATWTGWGIAPTSSSTQFKIIGRRAFCDIDGTGGKAHASLTSANVSLPFKARDLGFSGAAWGGAVGYAVDAGTIRTGACRWSVAGGAALVATSADMASAAWTTGSALEKRLRLTCWFDI